MRWITAAMLFLVCSGCASVHPTGTPETFTVEGKTRYRQRSLPSGEIMALRAEPGGRVYKANVGVDGNFHLHLDAGAYFLMGRGRDPESGRELFSFWSNNPLQVNGDIREPVVLPFVVSTGLPESSAGRGIRGRVMSGDKPVEGAVVAAYLDAAGQFRGQPYAQSTPTDPGGEYYLAVPPGKFFILARYRRKTGSYQGPLLKGDLSGFYPHNPIILRTGEMLTADIPMVTINRPRGQGTLAPGETVVVRGSVSLEGGGSVSGVRVLLYTVPEMLGRPDYVSSPTDDEGRYELEVPLEGTYYAVARSFIGGPPKEGDLMGYYEGNQDHSFVLRRGEDAEGVDFVVREIW